MVPARATKKRRQATAHVNPLPATVLSPTSRRNSGPLAVVVWLLLAAACFAAYYPAVHGTPVWDDDAHITRSELRPIDGLRRIWLEPGATQQWYPVVHSAFWLLGRVDGGQTTVYH